MFNLDEYLRDLTELCAYDSGKHNKEGIQKVIDWFRPRYEALGFYCTQVVNDGHDEVPMLIISNEADYAKKPLDVVFVSHMDTVFDTETVKNWPVTIENGKAHGPGVIDCKGGCLLEYYLIREMAGAGQINFTFAVAMNSDEETGSVYSYKFFETLSAHTKYCLVFEPGRAGREFVGVRKGGAKYRITAHGIAAHSGADFFKGANAIEELARWVPEFTSLISKETGTTVNIAEFHGGLNNGQVPDRAELTMRLLYLDPSEIEKMDAVFQRTQKPFDPRCSIEITELGIRRPPMIMTANSEKLFGCLDVAGKETSVSTEWVSTGGMSDGNWFGASDAGILDGCGPSGDHMHTTDEYLELASVEPRFRIMRQLLVDLFEK